MATFLICHGAWSAGWAWKKVRPLLRAAGHEVFTPTYTGLGERAHHASPAVDLEMHIADALAVIEFEALEDITLVGHSYGGMVATGVADRAPERIRQLVYLDAFVPGHGQSLLDLLPPGRGARGPPGVAHCAQPDAARYVRGRSRVDHAQTAAAAGEDLQPATALAHLVADVSAQLHLLHEEGGGRSVPAVLQALQVRSAMALFRDRRQPQPQRHGAGGTGALAVRDRGLAALRPREGTTAQERL